MRLMEKEKKIRMLTSTWPKFYLHGEHSSMAGRLFSLQNFLCMGQSFCWQSVPQ